MPAIPFNTLEDQSFSEEVKGPETEIKQHPVRKRWLKWILSSIFVGIAILIGIACVVYDLSSKGSPSSQSNTGSPSSPSPTEMDRDMKTSEYPCNDFYEYSCGGYIDRYLPFRYTYSIVFKDRFSSLEENNKNRARKVIEGMGSTKDPFFKKAFVFYKACMNNARSMDAYFRAADEIGGSDITTVGPFDYANWNLETALTKMKVQYNVNPLFTIQVGHDLFNASRNILLINPPDFHLLAKVASEDNKVPRFKERSNFEDVFEYDLNAVSSLVETFNTRLRGKFVSSASDRTGKSYYETYNAVLDATIFESSILKDIIATFTGSILHERYQVITVHELNFVTGYTISWSSLLQSLQPKGLSFNINNDTEIGLMVPLNYLRKIKSYASYTQKRIHIRKWCSTDERVEKILGLDAIYLKLPNYFAWFLLKKFSPVLPDDYFAQYYFKASATDLGKKGKEKWRACLLETEKTMPFSVGMMFAKDVITPLTVNKVSEMLKEIKSAFKNGTKQLPWLDQATRDAVDVKIDDVLQTIAGPDLFKAGWLSNLYKDVIVGGKTYAQMFESAQRNMVQINLKRYFQPAKRNEFHFDGSVPDLYSVNAFYARTKNLIRILAGIMRAPFLYENGPSYLNFAKLGAVLGHELLHGFDNHGWNYDKFGQISPWTTKYSQDGFKVRADCIRNQYSAYKSGSLYINGTKTLAENIADNAGLKYAYSAYKSLAARRHPNEAKPAGLEHLSYDQLFFIGYAQMWCRAASYRVKDYIDHRDKHSPSKYRVIGSVSNFKPFAEAFKCGLGSRMNPVKKCEFW